MGVSLHTLAAGLLIAGLVLSAGRDASGQVIFIDGFEKGVPGDAVGTGTDIEPWITTSPNRSTYAEKPPEFEGGFVTAHFLDNGLEFGTELGSPDLRDSIGGQITTASFDFMEVGGKGIGQGLKSCYGIGFPGIPECNSTQRSFGTTLLNGVLDAYGDITEGAPVNYPVDQVHTLFMVVNETDSPLPNYRDGHTLEPQEADIWLQTSGSDSPQFAFSAVHNPNSLGVDSRYFVWRAFTGDQTEAYFDNMLVVPGASFDRDFDFGNRIPGDVNNDKFVDRLDYDIIRNHFFEAVASREDGDVTEDGFVDYLDYRQWKDAYVPPGTGAAALTSPVPEPSSVVLLQIAAICCGLGSPRGVLARRGRHARRIAVTNLDCRSILY